MKTKAHKKVKEQTEEGPLADTTGEPRQLNVQPLKKGISQTSRDGRPACKVRASPQGHRERQAASIVLASQTAINKHCWRLRERSPSFSVSHLTNGFDDESSEYRDLVCFSGRKKENETGGGGSRGRR